MKIRSFCVLWLVLAALATWVAGCNPESSGPPPVPATEAPSPGGGLAAPDVGGAHGPDAVPFPVGDPTATGPTGDWYVSQGFTGEHLGTDYSRPGTRDIDEAVYSAAGVVVAAGDFSGWGGVVAVRSTAPTGKVWRLPDGSTAAEVVFVFGHVTATVAVGDQVARGAIVGRIEPLRPGVHSTGPHLHLEVLPARAGALPALPGPGYSSDAAVRATRVDPAAFLALNRLGATPAPAPAPSTPSQGSPQAGWTVRTVATFDSGPFDVVALGPDEVAVTTRGAVTGAPAGAVHRVDLRTGTATRLVDGLYLAGGLDHDRAGGRLLVAVPGENRVLEVILATGAVNRLVGAGPGTPSADGTPAAQATLVQPADVAFDPAGRRLVITETGNHRVRALGPDNLLSTLAGTGVAGSAGDGGAPELAEVAFPSAIVQPDPGVFYLEEQGRVRRIGGGVITRVASVDGALALTFEPAGHLWFTRRNAHDVQRLLGTTVEPVAGGAAGYADGPAASARFSGPQGVAFVGERLVLCDHGNRALRVVERAGP